MSRDYLLSKPNETPFAPSNLLLTSVTLALCLDLKHRAGSESENPFLKDPACKIYVPLMVKKHSASNVMLPTHPHLFFYILAQFGQV